MSELFDLPAELGLANVERLKQRAQRDTGVGQTELPAHEVKSIGVIGVGNMGAQVASICAGRGLHVTIYDASDDALVRAADEIRQQWGAERLTVARSYEDLADCDLVIESVAENVDVKRQIYERLETQLGPAAVMASNTSTIPISDLADRLQRPARFCGLHFCNPVHQRLLVEVVRGDSTSDQTTATAIAVGKQIGKLPVVVRDGPGFLVNRLLLPYLTESLELICDGAEIESIERAAESFGMLMGPLAMYDMIGLEIAMYAGLSMWEAFRDRMRPSPLVPALVKRGRLGWKSGRGFLMYRDGSTRGEPDPELAEIFAPYIRGSGDFSQEQIICRLILPMLLEATRVLEENLVRDPRDVDLGVLHGLGFPPEMGGLLYWADHVGADRIVKVVSRLEDLGQRAQPTPLLARMAAAGERFYG